MARQTVTMMTQRLGQRMQGGSAPFATKIAAPFVDAVDAAVVSLPHTDAACVHAGRSPFLPVNATAIGVVAAAVLLAFGIAAAEKTVVVASARAGWEGGRTGGRDLHHRHLRLDGAVQKKTQLRAHKHQPQRRMKEKVLG
jgi:hypothetical protein